MRYQGIEGYYVVCICELTRGCGVLFGVSVRGVEVTPCVFAGARGGDGFGEQH